MADQSPVILVCDDDPDTRAIVSHSLSVLGYTIVQAEDGAVAQLVCKSSLPDVIVLDIMMPHITGTEFLRWFRAEFKDRFVPVLLLTALDAVENKVEGFETGADDYLTKPFHFRELQARVQALLRIKALTEKLRSRTSELEQANEDLARTQEKLLAKERELVAAQMAGAAAHSLGQPLTTILLHCKLAEGKIQAAREERKLGEDAAAALADSISAIKMECKSIDGILSRLRIVDGNQLAKYIDGMEIVDLDSETAGKKDIADE